ncbi:MAG: hypothetical protein IJE97_16150 [Thermoguttaceae bacterium]|nr:hypothetical protein [Thermoguttaceae bacterium]MBQ7111864.1 hypothetical protein [Thermoguttaceae bacterium]
MTAAGEAGGWETGVWEAGGWETGVGKRASANAAVNGGNFLKLRAVEERKPEPERVRGFLVSAVEI